MILDEAWISQPTEQPLWAYATLALLCSVYCFVLLIKCNKIIALVLSAAERAVGKNWYSRFDLTSQDFSWNFNCWIIEISIYCSIYDGLLKWLHNHFRKHFGGATNLVVNLNYYCTLLISIEPIKLMFVRGVLVYHCNSIQLARGTV